MLRRPWRAYVTPQEYWDTAASALLSPLNTRGHAIPCSVRLTGVFSHDEVPYLSHGICMTGSCPIVLVTTRQRILASLPFPCSDLLLAREMRQRTPGACGSPQYQYRGIEVYSIEVYSIEVYSIEV